MCTHSVIQQAQSHRLGALQPTVESIRQVPNGRSQFRLVETGDSHDYQPARTRQCIAPAEPAEPAAKPTKPTKSGKPATESAESSE